MKLKIICTIAFLGLFVIEANAQCRTFAKNTCETQLEGYMLNGRMYGGFLTQGQEMDLVVVLNGGQTYRLVNCSKPTLGEIQIQLIDSDGNIVFNNVDHEMAQDWDFDVKSTQEFTIKTIIPSPSKSQGSSARDCSILLIGSKSSS